MNTEEIYDSILKGTEFKTVSDSTYIPFSTDTNALISTAEIGGYTVSNRICYQPMEGQDGENGAPTQLTLRRYRRLADGGAGIIWFEAVAVCREGKSNPYQLQITEENLPSFSELVREIKLSCQLENGYEPVIIMQLTHSGRFSKPDGVPSPVGADDENYLKRLIPLYAKSAELAMRAGFSGVDVKCCHGYLLSQLLSFGKTDIILMIAEAVSNAVHNKGILASRLNAYDGYDGNFILAQTDLLISQLESLGFGLFNITMGSPYINPDVSRPYRNGIQSPKQNPIDSLSRLLEGCRSLRMKHPASAFVCTGLSLLGAYAPLCANGVVDEGICDFAGFGRMSFAYPDFARSVLNGSFDEKKVCVACSGCSELKKAGLTSGCMIRDPFYRSVFKKFNDK